MSNSSNHNPLVSILMITYNHEKYIAKALDSVLMQKVNFDYEIVVGEDYSTDGTRDIVIEYKNKNSGKINLIIGDKHLGATENCIKTLKACKGKYLAILDGDDYWSDPHKLQKQVDFLENNPDYAICYHPIEHLYEDQEPKRIFDINHGENETTYTEDLIKNDYIPACSSVMRRDNIKEIPSWFTNLTGMDWVLLLMASFGKKIFRLNDKMAVYRVSNRSTWGTKKYSYLLANSLVMLKFLEKDTPERYLQNIHDKIFDVCIELYKTYLVENKIIAALKLIPGIYSTKHHQTMKAYFTATEIIVVSFIRKFIKKRNNN